MSRKKVVPQSIVYAEDLQLFLSTAAENKITVHGYIPVFDDPVSAAMMGFSNLKLIDTAETEACQCPDCVEGREKAAVQTTSETIH